MALKAGDKLGPYKIVSPIGKGGMGEVWKARDSRLNRDVAIKFCLNQFSDRFLREARAIAALNHPNICTLFDVGPDCLVMEYIEGTPPRGPLAPAEAVRLSLGIAAALEAAHGKGITHRDLKPANILVTQSGVKLLDFGLALVTDNVGVGIAGIDVGNTLTALSADGAVMGTVGYMSPEQAQGKPADARSDIFSFGVVLYELLSGRRAFAGNCRVETMAAIIRDEPAPLGAPARLSEIVTRCLRKSPASRFQAISEVRVALEKAAQELEVPELFRSPTVGFEIRKPLSWHYTTVEQHTENLRSLKLDDKEFTAAMVKHASVPLVAFTKFPEPYTDLSPTFKVIVRPLGELKGHPPTDIIQLFMLAPLERAFRDVQVAQPPTDMVVAGINAAYARIDCTLQTVDSQIFTATELWVIPREDIFFMLGAATRPDERTGSRKEIAEIVSSVRIEH
jgi:serine/threonine protein kinase